MYIEASAAPPNRTCAIHARCGRRRNDMKIDSLKLEYFG
ncbi:hypothetical protein DM47_3135 [Burkholderia mallei]|nr:hypothetical protein DM49_3744 [Burkholderia mallei]KOT20470.1 hypothetical protein DM47_3135 [Burkholderia mallei]